METVVYTMHVLREMIKYKICLEILKGIRTLSQGGDRDCTLKMFLSIGHLEIKIFLYNNKQLWFVACFHRICNAYTTIDTEATLYSYWQTFGSHYTHTTPHV